MQVPLSDGGYEAGGAIGRGFGGPTCMRWAAWTAEVWMVTQHSATAPRTAAAAASGPSAVGPDAGAASSARKRRATSRRASAGHSVNQSIDVLFTSAADGEGEHYPSVVPIHPWSWFQST